MDHVNLTKFPHLSFALTSLLLVAPGCGNLDPNGDIENVAREITINPSANYTLVGVQSSKCVEVQGGSTANGARLQIATCNGATRQQFRAEAMGGVYYRLRNVNSNLCVDVNGASTANGASIIQWSCGTGTNQQWSFTDVAGGAEVLKVRHSGQVLDVTGGKTTDGTFLEQWPSKGGTNQQFKMLTGGMGTGGTTSTGGAGPGTGGATGTGGSGGSGGSLAATPPMGWNSWNKFGCNVSEALIKSMADAMVTTGMRDAGYKYVNIDDCWQVSRSADGTIVASTSFTNGSLKTVADYVHSLGMKLGAYSDRGTKTCAGRPGGQGYEVKDANTYAAWGVDYLKYDNCNVSLDEETQYRTMGNALRASGRPIMFSICAWHFSSWMPSVGNLWRTTGDISDNWGSMTGNLDKNAGLAQYAGPGHWNDPDMLEVGNGGMTDTEYRSHFSMWAMMAAPLIAGNDLRNMSQATKDILTNADVIAVDQDALGIQGKQINTGSLQVWSKKLTGNNTYAVALFNRTTASATMTVTWSSLGITSGTATVRDLWTHTNLGAIATQYSATVPAHGTVMLKVVGN